MKYKTYTSEQINQVKSLSENGKNQCEISRITGIPRGTLRFWIKPSYVRKTNKPRNSYSPIENPLTYLNSEELKRAYSFILGVYLCDGCISRYKAYRAPAIRFVNDSKYPNNTKEWAENLQKIFPDNSVNVHKHYKSNCNIVLCYSRKLLDLFPQYGEGKKHNRKISLEEWQKQILSQYPEEFIRACFQSDGCIYQQKIGSKTYKRYSFSNMSLDIIEIFLFCLEKIGVNKDIYRHKSKGLYLIQNFKKEHVQVLNKIIDKKE